MSLGRSAAALLAGIAARRAPGTGSRSRGGRSYVFTSLTPIEAEREGGLTAHLEALPMGRDSPLARLRYVHLARWLVIDDLKMGWPGAPRRPTRLRSKYLLFTANITGPATGDYAKDLPGSFLRELAAKIPNEADEIWGNCVGYPGTDSVDGFVAYLTRSQLDTVLFYVGYPDVTVDDVNRALDAREGIVGFVRRHQGEITPAQLQQAYLEESATWWP